MVKTCIETLLRCIATIETLTMALRLFFFLLNLESTERTVYETQLGPEVINLYNRRAARIAGINRKYAEKGPAL